MPFSSKPEAFAPKWLIPSLGSLPFLVLPVCLLFDPSLMLEDPGIGWHLVSGHYMIDHRTILTQDIFSFTKPEQPWVVKEWLFQCFAAGLDKIGGLPLVSTVSALLYGSLPIMLYKRMLRNNTNIYLAMSLLFVVFLGLMGHCHARPHMFTYFFFIILMDEIFSYDNNEISAAALFSFIPVMILWCNLHGGFLIGLASAGLALLVSFFQYMRFRNTQNFDKLKTYFLFCLGLALASLLNPLGWNLHINLLHYLSSDLLHQWNEFNSPDFNSARAFETIFLFSILGFFLILFQKKHKISPLEITFLVFFLYQSFHAVRHVFLFLLLAIPIISRELTGMMSDHDNRFTRRSDILLAEQQQIKSDWIHIPLICVIFIILSLTMPALFKTDLYGKRLDPKTGNFIKQNIEQFRWPFNNMEIGGTLIYHFWPEIKVFADDRLDYYGDGFFKDYIKVARIHADWKTVLNKNKIDAAIVTSPPLATVMTESPDWKMVFQEKNNYIFLRAKGLPQE
jgi:hypothetical protein